MEKLGIYIHIPFCKSKCDYCNFVSFCLNEKAQQDYLRALFSEIDLIKNLHKNNTFNSVFIGGGTPSIVFDGFILALSKKLFESFNISKNFEFTIEVNPSSFNEQKLQEYLRASVNRISMGVQSIESDLTQKVGRNQTKEDVERAFKVLSQHNFNNINADVMLGLPNQTYTSVENTINFLINHNVKHISMYGLQIEPNTPLFKQIKNGEITVLNDDEVAELFEKSATLLKQAGFEQYEISNFALAGYECEHNKKYWDGTEYVGLGISAHSFVNEVRFCNTSHYDEYISLLQKGKLPIVYQEKLTTEQKRTERIMLALRTRAGLNLAEFEAEFGENLLKTRKTQINNLLNIKKIELKNGCLRITEENMYVSNSIILELL